MARLITCGFENLAPTKELPGGASTVAATGAAAVAVETSVLRAYGAGAVRCTGGATGKASAYISLINAASATYNYSRTYFRIVTMPTGTIRIAQALRSTADRAYVELSSSGVLTLRSDTGTSLGTSGTLSTGVWYGLGIKILNAGSPEIEARLWTDGVSTPSAFGSGSMTASTDPNEFEAGVLTADATAVLVLEDIALNDGSGSVQNSYPGEGFIVHLRPNAAGDNNAWEKSGGGAGDASNYQSCDEVSPDDATTYLRRTSVQPIDDYNLTSTASAGIPSGVSITLVSATGEVGAISNTAVAGRQLKYRIKSQASGTVVASADSYASVNGWTVGQRSAAGTASGAQDPHVTYVDPQAGGVWTAALLDTAQVGIQPATSTTTEIRVSALWVAVEFVISIVEVTSTLASTWNVKVSAEATVATEWDVAAEVVSTVETTWDVTGVVTSTLATSWDVVGEVIATLATSWDVATASAELVSPINNARVPSATPVFQVSAYLTEAGTPSGTVQVSEDPTFLSGVTSIAFEPINMTGEVISRIVMPDELDEDTTYYWRARITNGDVVSGWTEVWSFVVDPDVGTASSYGYWGDVAAGTAGPHVWFSVPTRGAPGDTVVVYGTGFGASPVVEVAGLPATDESVDAVPATGSAYGSDRAIDSAGSVVDPEHDEVTFTVPSGFASPGGQLTVEH